jgi:hypothetical protein
MNMENVISIYKSETLSSFYEIGKLFNATELIHSVSHRRAKLDMTETSMFFCIVWVKLS